MSSAVRFAVAWLAAWCQVVVIATMPLGALATSVGPFGSMPLCHAGGDDEQPVPSQPNHDDHDCVLCVLCQLHGTVAFVTAPGPILPKPQSIAPISFHVAQPRAPPLFPIIAARPRGPPSLTLNRT